MALSFSCTPLPVTALRYNVERIVSWSQHSVNCLLLSRRSGGTLRAGKVAVSCKQVLHSKRWRVIFQSLTSDLSPSLLTPWAFPVPPPGRCIFPVSAVCSSVLPRAVIVLSCALVPGCLVHQVPDFLTVTFLFCTVVVPCCALSGCSVRRCPTDCVQGLCYAVPCRLSCLVLCRTALGISRGIQGVSPCPTANRYGQHPGLGVPLSYGDTKRSTDQEEIDGALARTRLHGCPSRHPASTLRRP